MGVKSKREIISTSDFTALLLRKTLGRSPNHVINNPSVRVWLAVFYGCLSVWMKK